jgi:hypothetical protein
MRLVLLDLGDTFEVDDQLLPAAKGILVAVAALTDPDGEPVVPALVSDLASSAQPANDTARWREYAGILDALGINFLFEPLHRRRRRPAAQVMLGPDPTVLRAAAGKAGSGLTPHHVMIVSENAQHVHAARRRGIAAIHFRGPGQASGDVDQLPDLVPLIRRWVAFSPCDKKRAAALGLRPSQANRSKRVDPAVQALATQVNAGRLRDTITHLAGFGTRYCQSPSIGRVPEWIYAQFMALGYAAGTSVRYQPFDLLGSGTQQNVLCSHGPDGRGIILVCGHYDSTSEIPGVLAPGADDNASGVAAILELARILQPVALSRQVLFAAFGGEELCLCGSDACAEIAARDHWPIELVINLDMVAYDLNPGGVARVVVEYDQNNTHTGNDAAAKAFGLAMGQAVIDYTTLQVDYANISDSDYMPFEAKGYACIGLYEGVGSPYYHCSTDVPAHADVTYLGEVVKAVLATILILAG